MQVEDEGWVGSWSLVFSVCLSQCGISEEAGARVVRVPLFPACHIWGQADASMSMGWRGRGTLYFRITFSRNLASAP